MELNRFEYVRVGELAQRLSVGEQFVRDKFNSLPPPAVLKLSRKCVLYHPRLCLLALSNPELLPEALEQCQREMIGHSKGKKK